MKTDLGVFLGSAYTRRSQEPAFTAGNLRWLGAITLIIILGAAYQLAPVAI